MNELHEAYLNLGSNIQPEINLVQAIELLVEYGEIRRISNAWESKSVGAVAPNYLNACILFISPLGQVELKEQAIWPIETRLGRKRGEDKYVPRPIDIDIVLFDGAIYKEGFWKSAFVVLPLAQIYPEYQNPITGENITETARRLRQDVWMETRPEVLSRFSGRNFNV
jgi:2-amino-4-hydroxy-6-hydroxymethyldihydropteridine diphosphokinase